MKTIFNDPIGWAQKVAGTRKKYRLSQFFTILLGILVYALLFVMQAKNIPPDYVPLHVILFGVLIVFPLCYLKAIRALIESWLKNERAASKDKNT